MLPFGNIGLKVFDCLFPDGRAGSYSTENNASNPDKAPSHLKELLNTHKYTLLNAIISQ